MSKIEINNVFKIFGPKPSSVLQMVKDGSSKEEILEKTGHTVGLDNVTLKINEGETFVCMGLSGSGKSTLIRHLNRLIDPTDGEILIEGTNVMSLKKEELIDFRRHKMSMVFQRFGLFPHKTVLQNVGYGLEMQGVELEKRNNVSMEKIESVGLTGFENQFPNQLSGGMQQRVGLARALATDAEILLMDEAFSALDPLIRADMQNILLDLQNELHKTIVFITHDLDEALKIGDRIAILRDGLIVQDSDPQEIILKPADKYVSDFIKDINRARVIKAKSIMTKSTSKIKDAVSINHNMVLEDVLQEITKNPGAIISVTNDSKKIIGKISIEELLNGIKRPVSKTNNYT